MFTLIVFARPHVQTHMDRYIHTHLIPARHISILSIYDCIITIISGSSGIHNIHFIY